MTPDQVSLVKESWKMVVPIAEQAAALFYNRLFESFGLVTTFAPIMGRPPAWSQ